MRLRLPSLPTSLPLSISPSLSLCLPLPLQIALLILCSSLSCPTLQFLHCLSALQPLSLSLSLSFTTSFVVPLSLSPSSSLSLSLSSLCASFYALFRLPVCLSLCLCSNSFLARAFSHTLTQNGPHLIRSAAVFHQIPQCFMPLLPAVSPSRTVLAPLYTALYTRLSPARDGGHALL